MQHQDPSANAPIIDNQNMEATMPSVMEQNENPYRDVPSLPDNFSMEMVAPPDGYTNPADNDLTTNSSVENVQQIIQPFPIPILKRNVSGTYISTQNGFRMELRVDVDGVTRLNRVSFDFFQVTSVISYWGSFQVNAPAISITNTMVTISGTITNRTRDIWGTRVVITIPRRTIIQPAAAAVLTFYNGATAGAQYTCIFNSSYFRTVRLETDVENGTTLAGDYNTNSFAHPGTSRILNVVKAFQEAGVNMIYTGRNNVINTSEAGADAKWTDAEMHASMVRHFSAFRNVQQWALWLFAARRATSSTLLGIMFDYTGVNPHRQGAAVFQDTLRGYFSGADYNRNQLFTYVHELGHAFNLLHSWDKGRPDSLSWMNYPWGYDNRNGAGRFWNNFTFNFDQGELNHLRHGFYNNVIMGGNNWAVGAGLEHPHQNDDSLSMQIIENNTGLQLEVCPVKTSYKLGEPVVVEIKLRNMDKRPKEVNAHIHPKYENVKIGIMSADGKVSTFEHLAHYLMAEDKVELSGDNDTLYASAYIGYGKDGFYFSSPGVYTIKGAFKTEDGSVIQSEEVNIRVKSALNEADEEIVDLYMTDEVGVQFTLLGSDSPELASGLENLKQVSEKYSKHELSVYADLILGANKAMVFKTVEPSTKSVVVRDRDTSQADAHLKKVFEKSKGEDGIDNITLNWAFRQLATAYFREGDDKVAKNVLQKMTKCFEDKNLKAPVMERIEQQANMVMRPANK